MAPTRKPANRRQRRGTKDLDTPDGAQIEVLNGETPTPVKAPPAERTWLGETRDGWRDFWASDLARHIKQTDRPALKRLFRLRDQLIRAQRTAAELRKKALDEPTVTGSMGQTVANPLFRVADSATTEALALEPRIVALEDRLGLSPRARLALGIAEQTGHNLVGQNQLLAGKLLEALGAHDPRSMEGNTAAPTR